MLKAKTFYTDSAIVSVGAFILSAVSGFVLSGASMAGVSSFADAALTGGLGLPSSAAVLTGSLVRSIIGGTVGRNIVKIAAMVIILILKMFLEPKNNPRLCGIITFVGIFVSGATVSMLMGEVLYKLIFYVFYGALAGFTSYSVSLIITGLRTKKAVDLSAPSGCAYAVSYTLLMASMCSVRFPLINIGIVLGAAVTLSAAYFYRHTGGVLCGALTTCGAFLSSSSCGMTVVLLPAAGLLTGYLYKQKINVAAAFFVGLNFIMMMLTGISLDSVSSMVNIACGAALFLVIAPYYSDKWVITGEDSTSALPEILSSRMSFLSDSIGNVRRESEKIAEMLSQNSSKENETEESSNEICSRCFRRLSCWKTDYDSTLRGFRKLSQLNEFSKESFPYELTDCLHKSELRERFEREAREKATAKLLEMRYSESRKLLSEQIKIIEEVAASAGERVDVRYSEPISKIIRSKLNKFGFKPNSVIAYYNSRNRLLAEIYFPFKNAPESIRRICDLVSDELRIPLDCADPVNSGKEVRLRLFERPEYSLQVYGASVCADNSKENGDTSMIFSDGTGISYVILSDGMGSGKNAAVESRIVVRMFRRLISSGADYSSAIKLINSIMLTKSHDEAFATLDAARIDLDNCGLTVIKSGATATLIRHRGSVLKVSSPTFPIGIYEQSDTFSRSYDFEDGDIVIMFSDGISENAYSFIKELLLSGDDLKKMVDEICIKSEVFNPSSKSDDVTVIGIKIIKTSHV